MNQATARRKSLWSLSRGLMGSTAIAVSMAMAMAMATAMGIAGCRVPGGALYGPVFKLGQNLPPLASIEKTDGYDGAVVLDERRLTLELDVMTGNRCARLDVHRVVRVERASGASLGNFSIAYRADDSIINTSPARNSLRCTDLGENTPTCSQSCCASVAMK